MDERAFASSDASNTVVEAIAACNRSMCERLCDYATVLYDFVWLCFLPHGLFEFAFLPLSALSPISTSLSSSFHFYLYATYYLLAILYSACDLDWIFMAISFVRLLTARVLY